MNILFIALIIIGLYLLLLSLASNTENFLSAIVFKFIPFISGVINIILGLELLEITNIL